ncbi:hypothetical protein [Streptomonospora litoralis]|uniref:Uncharacterized protein n=1 Tax=Streptomonospora litoralis TaxID=2498135 RepID=A0A4P6Q0P6_9ACTN|nr:hypothetical protein [Streptomonospora litoralis]QBI54206.1 hypothetical protein EKD16_12115 [Streptomonospora litoralis]
MPDGDRRSGGDRDASGAGAREEERPLADRRPGDQGDLPAPDEDIAGEREPSPSDPASYDPSQEGDEPPERPTRA